MQEKMITTALQVPATPARKVKGVTRESDTSLGWVEQDYPQLSVWRGLAVEWVKGETNGLRSKLQSIVAFFERYLIEQSLPLDPSLLLARNTVLPDFYRTVCPDSAEGVRYNNHINAFLQFVLAHHFSEEDDLGRPVVSPAVHNPVPWMSKSGLPRLDESVHSPLPYGYIDELRRLLAAGPHFRDWQWAQGALGAELGVRGTPAPDWFEVTEAQINKNDPDCVWRIRKFATNHRGGEVLQMWSPARWVALLVKLILPLRTFQVRTLDSGEADTWRYAAGNWTLNPSRLAQGSERRPLQQGVFRRSQPLTDGEDVPAVLYVNTNKTADINKSGADKGYVLAWSLNGPDHQNVFYWLEKLCNWQETYNPVSQRTAWTELDARHIKAKSEVQLASYPDACFLFRMPEASERERNLTLRNGILESSWFSLLGSLEQRLADRGETHRNGTPIRFLPPPDEQKNGATTLFPLHSLRVSLITAFALEGQVPFPVLQKLVGHSRLMMTLYYTKPGAAHISCVLHEATQRLEANKAISVLHFLQDTEHEELLQKAICNSVASLAAAIPQHPAARNPAGWMLMHHGLCLVGGNTGEIEGNGAVGGCYNGGQNLGSTLAPRYGPVAGGSRNCVRCRWFVTEPHHLPALAAHFNTLSYHFDEARNSCVVREAELCALQKQKFDAENAGLPFAHQNTCLQVERLWESALKRFSDLAEDLVACWRLIERCKAALDAPQGDGMQLVAAGTVGDVKIVFEETESELLQLAGVCDNAEVYPDLEPGKAVFRRSQLLDTALYNDDLPPVFMLLSEQEQLLAGNAFMRRLAHKMNPHHPALGQRQVIGLVDAGKKLSEHFGKDLTSLLPAAKSAQAFPAGRWNVPGVAI